MKIKKNMCCICGKKYEGMGNNVQPFKMEDAVVNVIEQRLFLSELK